MLPYGNDGAKRGIDVLIDEFSSWPISATTYVVMSMCLAKQGVDKQFRRLLKIGHKDEITGMIKNPCGPLKKLIEYIIN